MMVRSLGRFPLLAGGCCGALFALILAACGGQVSPLQQVLAVTHKAPAAPAALSQKTDADQVIKTGWTNRSTVRLSASLTSPDGAANLVPEVEFVPLDQPFAGKPTATGRPGDGYVESPPMAAEQQYHWQIRARDLGGPAGPWVPFDGSIGYEPSPPPSPSIAPIGQDGYVATKQVTVSWEAVAGKAGIAGYAYWADQSEDGQAPQQAMTKDTSGTVTLGQDGDWFVHVRTLDNAGNWSPTATAPLHLDSVPMKITDAFYRTFAYNPGISDPLPITVGISKEATVVLTILPDKADTPLRTYNLGRQPAGKVKVEWDGKDGNGALVPPGNYRFRVVATDRAGNKDDEIYDKLLVSNKRIVVSLSQQKLWAYDGDKLFISTLVTTGNKELPTPEGTFQVLTKQPNFVFHSPWPKGSPFWYPDSPTHFAMMFDDGGYFLHDAPWRHTFGPGSNLQPGQPGEERTGTHGCINLPLDAETKLFAWADLGTPVVIQQ
jgi:hypothetical protein